MRTSRNLNRHKIIAAAVELFSTQGVTETTTKQIAEAAAVNEVTLFRQFGNKHGLLLAVIEESELFSQLGQNLVGDLPPTGNLPQMLREYANTCLQALEQTPAVVRSLVGESGQYSIENRQVLGKSFERANRRVAKYLKTAIGESSTDLHLPVEQLASLLNTLLFGYVTIELTSEFHGLWCNRADFLDRVVALLLPSVITNNNVDSNQSSTQLIQPKVSVNYPDLPESIVHQILENARKQGLQIYAIVYLLFGSGVSVGELVRLNRSHHLSSRDRQILQITDGLERQVPINQSILGKRYGSYLKNPLTQWLKSRKDSDPALFLSLDATRLTENDLCQQWQQLTSELTTPTGKPPAIEQTQSTWCVEMFVRGLTIDTMKLLTGLEAERLEYYILRATEQLALAQAVSLDRGRN